MSRFIPGDYVRPTNTFSGLPRGSVWLVRRYRNSATGAVELGFVDTSTGRYPPSYVMGRVFADRNFEKVVMVSGQWRAAAECNVMVEPDAVFHFGGSVTGRISSRAPNLQQLPKDDPVESANKLVAAAASALEDAKEHARRAREEARARAKVEAKRKTETAAALKALEERRAISARLHKDRDLAAATVDLIAELSRLHNGGAEKDAASSIAAHVDQLQPLAKSYGYKIAKPGVIAIVVKA